MTIVELKTRIGQQVTGDSSFNGDVSKSTDYRDLTPDQQITITNLMKKYIREHPDEFPNPTQQRIANTPDIQLTEKYGVGAQVSDFFSYAGDEALKIGDSVADIGRGVMNTASLVKYGLPAVAIILTGIWIYGQYKKNGGK